MLNSTTRILIFIVLLIKSNVRVKGQTSPCPDYFKYAINGNEIQGVVTLPGMRGINLLEVKIVITGHYDRKDPVILDLLDEKEARKGFQTGGNIRYKIKFPKGLSKVPDILSISLNGQQYCDNQNALILDEDYVILGINLSVDAGSPKPLSAQPTIPVRPTIPVQQTNPVQPSIPVRPTIPVQPTFSADNLELDFDVLPTITTAPPPPIPQDINISDRDWLQSFSSNDQCGTHFTALHTIINGEDLKPNEFPWLVALFDNNRSYFCGGSLISDRHVITAAHCCRAQTWIFLEFGKHILSDKKETGVVVRISEQIINHPEYKPNTGHGDIALIIVSEKVTFSEKIKPICLWPFPSHEIGTKGIVAGWGNDISGSSTDTPMFADVNIVSDAVCLSSNPLYQAITSSATFCAGGNNKGPCQGDSGSGFIVNQNQRWYLKGVISVSLSSNPSAGLCDVNKFAVYCDVGQYLGWLKQYLV